MVTLEQLLEIDKVPALLLAEEVAKAMRVHPSTVRRQCEARKYPNAFKMPGAKSKTDLGDWRIPADDVRACLVNGQNTGEFAA